MTTKVAARLLKLPAAPIVPDSILAALRGEVADVAPLVRALQAESERVVKARQALADVPPVAAQTGPVLL